MKIKEIEQMFKKLEMETTHSGDLIGKFYYKGKLITRTKVSHGRGEIQGKVRHFIRQQLKLNEKDFKKILDCTYYKEDYISILKQKRYINC